MTEQYVLHPIGHVRSEHSNRKELPPQGRGKDITAIVHLREELEPAMREIRAGDQIWILCWFHQAARNILRVHPKGDPSRPETGVFSLRSPVRPNPVSMSLVEVLRVDGTNLHVRGLEMLDGTPVLDIKPHVPDLDS